MSLPTDSRLTRLGIKFSCEICNYIFVLREPSREHVSFLHSMTNVQTTYVFDMQEITAQYHSTLIIFIVNFRTDAKKSSTCKYITQIAARLCLLPSDKVNVNRMPELWRKIYRLPYRRSWMNKNQTVKEITNH